MSIIQDYISSGLSVIPVRADKRPLIDWKQYQIARAGAEAESWVLPIAVVCGAVSGGLTCIDFDNGGSAFNEYCERLKSIKAEILKSVYCQQTPSGGFHIVFRSTYKIENKKLAQRKTDGKVTVLIETRGEGGYFLLAPSAGYTQRRGDIKTLQPISADDAETLILVAESLNEHADDKSQPQQSKTTQRGITPFDDYDAKNTPIDLLTRNGWRVICSRAEKTMFCRPDKKGSISATWNHIPGRFYVFSTSTIFDAGHVYKPSAVYTMLEHRGDYVQAAKQLYKDGYGDRVEKKQVDYDITPVTTAVKMSDFKEQIYTYVRGNKEKGLRLGLKNFDEIIRFDRGYLNVVTGIPSHGKSEFIDFVSMLLAKEHKWNIVYFSPENYPIEIHFNKLADKQHNASIYGKGNEFIEESIDFIDEHYSFINATEEELTLDIILSACLDVHAKKRVDCLIIDPWNEVEQAAKPIGMNDSEFTGICLRKLRKFARKNNICLIIAVHPTKMYKDRDAKIYPVPSMYDISGSANWYNKADNGIVIYRNFEESNKTTDVYVKKVKFRNYGMVGHVTFTYDNNSGNYVEVSEQDLFYGGGQ